MTDHALPRDRFVEARGLRFHVREWPGAGQPIVLVHGLGSNARIWDLVAPALALGHRVVAYDQRGHGQSDKPDEPYDFATVCADLGALLDALDISRPLLVGHSWGGNVVLCAAARGADAAGIALVDGGFIDLQSRFSWEEAAVQLAPPDLSALTPAMLVERLRSGPLGEHWRPAIEQAVLANFEVTPAGTIRPHLTRDRHLRILRALWEERPTALYADVRCPTLIVPADFAGDPRGDDFRAARRAAVAAAAAAIPHATVLWMHDTIHDVPLQRPSALALVLRQFARDLAR